MMKKTVKQLFLLKVANNQEIYLPANIWNSSFDLMRKSTFSFVLLLKDCCFYFGEAVSQARGQKPYLFLYRFCSETINMLKRP